MQRNKLISICIPTYQRPKLLKEALESCFAQQYEPIEIIIGDDSQDDTTEKLVRDIQSSWNGKLYYTQNTPSLGQAGNVNMLFERANGERLVLLHDDDLLLPNALVDLARCWEIEPELTAAFGKQYFITMTGEILHSKSEEVNNFFSRAAEIEGLHTSIIKSALLQQFPNNCYMILSSAARSIKYREKNEVGNACDYDFGIRLALDFDKFYVLNKYTAKYRLTDVSITNSKNSQVNEYAYSMVNALKLPESYQDVRRQVLKRLAPLALKVYALQGKKKEALSIYSSEFYSLNNKFSLRGLYYLLLIFFPRFELIFSVAAVGKIKDFFRDHI